VSQIPAAGAIVDAKRVAQKTGGVEKEETTARKVQRMKVGDRMTPDGSGSLD